MRVRGRYGRAETWRNALSDIAFMGLMFLMYTDTIRDRRVRR